MHRGGYPAAINIPRFTPREHVVSPRPVHPPQSPPPHHKRARNHAEKHPKNLIYALHSSKVVLLCVHRLLRIVAVPPCTKKRTVPIPVRARTAKIKETKYEQAYFPAEQPPSR